MIPLDLAANVATLLQNLSKSKGPLAGLPFPQHHNSPHLKVTVPKNTRFMI